MNKRVSSYFNKKKIYSFLDIDFHDFMELVDQGYNNEEIAKELGVSKEQIKNIRDEINKDY